MKVDAIFCMHYTQRERNIITLYHTHTQCAYPLSQCISCSVFILVNPDNPEKYSENRIQNVNKYTLIKLKLCTKAFKTRKSDWSEGKYTEFAMAFSIVLTVVIAII